jgi:Leucine-rich repeat (LRR) protein
LQVPDSFARLRSLRSLLITHNRLTNIPIQLSALPRLERLNASSNRIVAVDCALPAIRCLVLDDNCLLSIPRGVCLSPQLQILSLERNRITEVPLDIGRLAELKTLKLAGNDGVSTVPEKVIGRLSGLRYIGLRATGIKSLPAILTESNLLAVADVNRLAIVDEGIEKPHAISAANNDSLIALSRDGL